VKKLGSVFLFPFVFDILGTGAWEGFHHSQVAAKAIWLAASAGRMYLANDMANLFNSV
jgi:hypothetical protein